MGLREALLKKSTQRELVEFNAGLEEPVYIISMRSSIANRFEAMLSSNKDKTSKDLADVRWMVLKECVVDVDGVPALTSDDRKLFDGWLRSFYEPIFEKCLEVSSVNKKDKEALGLDDEEKN